MQIGLSLFLIIDALDGFVDANGFVRQRYVLHLQSAEFSDPYTGKQCDEYASGLPVQVHVNALNKSLLLILGERDHLLDTQLFRVLYQVPVQQRDRPLFVGVLHSKAKYQDMDVEAKSLHEAIEYALGPECPLPEGSYVDDSIMVDTIAMECHDEARSKEIQAYLKKNGGE